MKKKSLESTEKLKLGAQSASASSGSDKAAGDAELLRLLNREGTLPPFAKDLDWHFAFVTITRCLAHPQYNGRAGFIVTDGSDHWRLLFARDSSDFPKGRGASNGTPRRSIATIPKAGTLAVAHWPSAAANRSLKRLLRLHFAAFPEDQPAAAEPPSLPSEQLEVVLTCLQQFLLSPLLASIYVAALPAGLAAGEVPAAAAEPLVAVEIDGALLRRS
jgi:hypothetical protein